jgi:GNAT superfamily N-acetyltransferase
MRRSDFKSRDQSGVRPGFQKRNPGLTVFRNQRGVVLSLAKMPSGFKALLRNDRSRYQNFIYADRIVVDAAFRGQGLARALYEVHGTAHLRRTLIIDLATAVRRIPEMGSSVGIERTDQPLLFDPPCASGLTDKDWYFLFASGRSRLLASSGVQILSGRRTGACTLMYKPVQSSSRWPPPLQSAAAGSRSAPPRASSLVRFQAPLIPVCLISTGTRFAGHSKLQRYFVCCRT